MDALRQLATVAFLDFVIPGLASTLMGYALFWWHRWTGHQSDEKARIRLNSAFENAIRFALMSVFGGRFPSFMADAQRQQVLTEAARYVETFNPGDVKRFKLDRDLLTERLMPLLPVDRQERSNLG